jgi:ABC-type sugar transport system substrate-binding protein
LKIGVCNSTLGIENYHLCKAAAEKWFAENAPGEVTFEWQPSEYDIEKQVSIVENFITRGFDCILFENITGDSGDTITKMIKDAKIPVVAFELKPSKEIADYFISCDGYNIGYAEVEEFAKLWKLEKGDAKADVVVITGSKGDSVAEEMHQGMMDAIAKYPFINVIMDQWVKDWSGEVAQNHVENILGATKNKVDAVINVGDCMQHACVQAAISAGVAKDIWWVSSEFDSNAIYWYEQGLKYIDIDKGQGVMGKYMAEVAYAFAKDGKYPVKDVLKDGQPVLYTPYYAVTYSNVEKATQEKFGKSVAMPSTIPYKEQ